MAKRYKHRATCHPNRWHHAGGLCRSCYSVKWFREKRMAWYKTHPGQPSEWRWSKQGGISVNGTGWTRDRFFEVLASQHGKCAICGEPMITPHEDHQHCLPPHPRGLLCAGCNMGLGYFKDESRVLMAAARYVFTHNVIRLTTSKVDKCRSKISPSL